MRYVLGNRDLLSLALMLTVLNFVGTTPAAQLVVLAKEFVGASDVQLGALFSAGTLGAVILSFLTGALTARMSLRIIIVVTMLVRGIATLGMGIVPLMVTVLPLWAVAAGAEALFNVAIVSVLQRCTPQQLLGRATSVMRVLAWSAIPLVLTQDRA
jgi:MFS family permease